MSQTRQAATRRNGQRRLATMVAREMAAAMRQLLEQQTANPPPPATVAHHAPLYNLKNFTSCHPPKYSGKDGATALLQWFESIESVFSIAECPNQLHVKYAASMFTKRALTWWNQEKLTRGMEAAHAMPWADLKTIMLAEFCPRNEVKKLESEFWELKQESGNNAEYTTRFHELSLLVPRLVTPVSVAIEKYVDGLPPTIRDIVLSSKPVLLEDAVRLAASLTDNLVKDGKLVRTSGSKGKKEKKDEKKAEVETEKPVSKKRKTGTSKNYVVTSFPNPTTQFAPQYPPPQNLVQPTQPRQNYVGIHPRCATCGYHHAPNQVCRFCMTCYRYGHLAPVCRRGAPPIPAPIPLNAQAARTGCFTCGGLDHFAKNCPNNRLALPPAPQPQPQPPARGRAFVINANPNPENNEEINGP